jgi:NitT/TauT family transport system substrate-binding protein
MTNSSHFNFTRRRFLSASAATGATSLLPFSAPAWAEPLPEVRRLRLLKAPPVCLAPQYIAEEMLRAEGFTEIDYVEPAQVRGTKAIAQNIADVSMWDAFSTLPVLDAGGPIVVLAGIHAGCWELFVNGHIDTLRDLKGKTVAIRAIDNGDYVLLSSMLAYVGINPRNEVNWIVGKTVSDAIKLFVEGKAAAFMSFAPQPQELRKKKIGRVLIDTAQDRPWSQYFCCMVTANREFVAHNPIATKRVLRAFLKAADVCTNEPERVARYLLERGIEPRYEISLEVLKSLPYARWREANPEDTLRFYALRLHEVGMIKTHPNKLIAQGTDWRFLNELKKELKA